MVGDGKHVVFGPQFFWGAYSCVALNVGRRVKSDSG